MNIKGLQRTPRSAIASPKVKHFASRLVYRPSLAVGFDMKGLRSTQGSSMSKSPKQAFRGLMGFIGRQT